MMRVFVTVLVLVLLSSAAIAQSTPLTGLAKDYQARGWEAVGRLDLGGGFCSATLISPSLVLSAAHCVYDASGRLRRADKVTFRAGLRNGNAAATRAIARIAAHPGFDPRTSMTLENVEHDLALLELVKPIPTHEIAPFVLHGGTVKRGPVSIVSYGKGRENLPSRQRACGLLERHSNVLMFDCDVTFGSSGAPVFSHLNGRGRILSVISGGARLRGGTYVALGPHLPPLVDALKRDLRRQTPLPGARIKRIGVGQQAGSGAKFVRVD